jgi:hypothetical protein
MNASLHARYPRWQKVLGALLWELVWKNRIVIPALLVFVALGGGLVLAVDNAPPDVWWSSYARGSGCILFLSSILLAFAPFTLMDNHGSWRMNSITSRWSVLPARTSFLVAVPLVVACVWLGVLVLVWTPILQKLCQGLDAMYILAVLLAGVIAAQALAWAIPRKPSQYWILAALLFLVTLLGAIVPQDRRAWEQIRPSAFQTVAGISLAGAFLALLAARRNRCGDWSGELPFAAFRQSLHRPGWGGRVFRRPVAALFWSEVIPGCRSFVLSWAALSAVLLGWVWFSWWLQWPGQKPNWLLISVGMLVEGLPNFAVLWLTTWSLFLGCEPGMGFQTRLTGFRSTRPLTVGMLAGTRIVSLVLIWMLAWVPLLILQQLIGYAGLPDRDVTVFSEQAARIMASRMAFTANAIVAALPLLLWGRFEGFPTIFLAALVGWAWSWALSNFVHQISPSDWLPWCLAGVLALRLVIALCLLARSLHQGYIGWPFFFALVGGWLGLVAGMSYLFGQWRTDALTDVFALTAMIPIVRLASCPLAVANNRHR